MTYVRQTWVDFIAGNTPTNAARFNWMEVGILDASNRIDTNITNIGTLQAWQTTQTQHPAFNGGAAPTAAAGSNAGTSPPAPVVNTASRDARGKVTWGTGTTPAAGNMVVVTFNTAYTTAPFIFLSNNDSATALLHPYAISITTTGFTIGLATAPAASQANTVYSATWVAIQ